MTEEEWLACTDPRPMLEFLGDRVSERKLRLFLCACCRDVQRHLDQLFYSRETRAALQTVERFADGRADAEELREARKAAEKAASCDARKEARSDAASAVESAAALPLTLLKAQKGAEYAAWQDRNRRPEQAGRLREVIGNPFRLAAIDPAWLFCNEGSVRKVAEAIYADRVFGEMPFLADALEDAGCTNPDILGHCRQPGPHIRGCWVLDLLVDASGWPVPAKRSEGDVETSSGGPGVVTTPRPQLRPGDWLCPSCHAHNFARRQTCHLCVTARPQPRLRPGDWLCASCHAHNFARRQTCHQCKSTRQS
jgi:hypothetical protein